LQAADKKKREAREAKLAEVAKTARKPVQKKPAKDVEKGMGAPGKKSQVVCVPPHRCDGVMLMM
jgi:hypothetical protein